MKLGDIRRWEYGWGPIESLTVRIICLVARGPMINELGAEQTVVELITQQEISPEARSSVGMAKLMLERTIDVIRSNIVEGKLPREDGLLVRSADLEIMGLDSFQRLKRRWKDEGCCPHCGHPGLWVALALCCPHHGIYI